MTLKIEIRVPSQSWVDQGYIYPPFRETLSFDYHDDHLKQAGGPIVRKFDLFTATSAVSSFETHTFVLANKDNRYGPENAFISGYRNARVDILFDGQQIWRGIVREGWHNRERNEIVLKTEDELARIMREPFGVPFATNRLLYNFPAVVASQNWGDPAAAIAATLGVGGWVTAGRFLSGRTNRSMGDTYPSGLAGIFLGGLNPIRLDGGAVSTFRERLLPLLSALGVALVPDGQNPGQLIVRPARPTQLSERLTDSSYSTNLLARFLKITDDDVKAGSFQETPAEAQVINEFRLKLYGQNDETSFLGTDGPLGRAASSRLHFGQRRVTLDLSLFRNGLGLFLPLSEHLDWMLRTRAWGARRCRLSVDLGRFKQKNDELAARQGGLPLDYTQMLFKRGMLLDLHFNTNEQRPLRGWWYPVGYGINYSRSEIQFFLEEGERNGWAWPIRDRNNSAGSDGL